MTQRYSRLATGQPEVATGSRLVRYVFSSGEVARDGHTIAPNGWALDAFRANPVALFAHDSSAPPVGRVTEIGVSAGALRGAITFADAETYPFADTVYRLVKGGYLSAASVSWMPLEWRYSTDKSRMGGIDFIRQELLEVSVVPVPSDTSALVTARSSGIDLAPLGEWAERALDQKLELPHLPRARIEALYRAARPLSRTGRVLSGVNEKHLRDAHDLIGQAAEKVRMVVDQVDGEEEDDGDEERAVRERKARALQLRHRHREDEEQMRARAKAAAARARHLHERPE